MKNGLDHNASSKGTDEIVSGDVAIAIRNNIKERKSSCASQFGCLLTQHLGKRARS